MYLLYVVFYMSDSLIDLKSEVMFMVEKSAAVGATLVYLLCL